MIFDTSEIQQHYIDECLRLGEGNKYPNLACVWNMDDPSAASFVRSIERMGEKARVKVELEPRNNHCRWSTTIDMVNRDESITGVLLISPPDFLPNYHNLIADEKNVEGNDYDDRVDRISCTAQAIARIAAEMIRKDSGDKPSHETWISELIEGKNVAIIGYGKAVGKPLSYLLMRHHAGSVATIHKYTSQETAYNILRNADIFVSATGHPEIFETIVSPDELVGKYIIDAGISEKDGKIVGDIDTERKFALVRLILA